MQIALMIPCYRPQALAKSVAAIQTQIEICTKLWPQVSFELWLIDDGANAAVATTIAQLKASHSAVHKLSLSRHFGYPAAVQAGLASVSAEAYVLIDPEHPALFEALVSMVDALVVGGYQVVGFVAKHQVCFRDCAFTAQVKRALLQGAGRGEFSLAHLAEIGFKQKRLAWIGPLPKHPTPPWLLWALAAVVVIALSFWPLGASVGNVILLGVCFELWQHHKPSGPSYVISEIE